MKTAFFKKIMFVFLALTMIVSLCMGFPMEAHAANGTITAEAQGTYTQSSEAQDVTIRISPNVSGSYCGFVIDSTTFPEGFKIKSFSTSNTNQAITAGDWNLDEGILTYLTNDMEDTIPADTYYDVVITAPANASGTYNVKFADVKIANIYNTNTLAEAAELSATFTIGPSGGTITAEAQGTYTQSSEAQDVTIRISPNVSGSYCGFVIDSTTFPEGFKIKSFSTSNTNQAITAGDWNLDEGILTYLTNDMEDTIPADTYYDVVITAPANASGTYNVKFADVKIANIYNTNILAEAAELSATFTIGESACVHTPSETVVENKVAADCTNPGSYDNVEYCSVCGEELSRVTVPVDALGHDWDDGEVTTKATCDKAGVKTFTCQKDATHTYTESISALGHNYVGVVTKEPTCTEDGERTFTCQNDAAHTYTEVIPGGHKDEDGDSICDVCGESLCKNHVPGEYVKENVIEATCTTTGSYDNVQYCTICGTEVFRHTVIVPLEAHKDEDGDYECDICGVMLCQNNNPVTLPAKAPTCTETGLTEGSYCGDCNQILVAQTVVPALGHNYVGVVTKEPTCTEDGVKTFTCQNDETHTYTATIPATGHKDENGDYKCDTCDAELCKNHIPGTPSVENYIPATCTRDGSYDTVVRCELCDVVISRVTTPIPATGHKDEDNDHHCDVCGVSLCEEHTWGEGVVTAPTCAGQGYTTHTCTVCGDSERYDYTDRLPHTPDNHWEMNSSQHYKVCTVCGQRTESHDHTFIVSGDNTCKYCTACGYTIGMRLVVNPFEVHHIPTALKDTYTTVEAIKGVMDKKAEEKVENGEDKYQILGSILKDVDLEYQDPETKEWIKVDDEHFPTDGKLVISIPVPEGIDPSKHQIHVIHMFASDAFGRIPGNMERPTVTVSVDEEGKPVLVFEVTGLSPVLIAYGCIDNHAHTEVRNAKEATCTAEGYTGDKYCTTCGEKVETGTAIGKINHTAGEPVRENETAVSYEEVVYCAVCKAELSRTLKVKENTGIVCWNMQTGVYYDDLSDAVNAAKSTADVETIQMLADYVEEDFIYLRTGTTLDLASYTVTAQDSVFGVKGAYITGDVGKGALVVSDIEFNMNEAPYVDSKGFSILPVKTQEVDGVKTYKFYRFEVNTDKAKDPKRGLTVIEDGVYFQFVTNMSGGAATLLKDGAKDNEVAIRVYLQWSDDQGTHKQEFVYSEESVINVCNGGKDFYLNLIGLNSLGIATGTTVYVYSAVESTCGIVEASDPFSFVYSAE